MYENRINQVIQKLDEHNLDSLYVTNITNVRYLSGFTGSAGSMLISKEKSYFFTDGRYTEQVKNQVQNSQIFITGSTHVKEIYNQKIIKNNSRVGFEANHVSYSLYRCLVGQFPNTTWISTENIVEHIAAVKDINEIDSLKTAIQITDKVFDEILTLLAPGVSESKIAATISYKFKEYGADGDSYDPIVASGWRSALPHATPTEKKLEKGDFVVMDFGALYNGYHADMTRTVLIGKATQKHRDIYSIVSDSQIAGIKKAKAGVTGADVDKACRDVIEKAGYGKFFTHSTGHGIGLEVHTLPRLSSANKTKLLENYVVTIEPGIYIPKWGGVRIEDDCLLAKDSCIPLNKSTKELLEL